MRMWLTSWRRTTEPNRTPSSAVPHEAARGSSSRHRTGLPTHGGRTHHFSDQRSREHHESALSDESEGLLPRAAIAAGGDDWLAWTRPELLCEHASER